MLAKRLAKYISRTAEKAKISKGRIMGLLDIAKGNGAQKMTQHLHVEE
jgi:hypothetical protein